MRSLIWGTALSLGVTALLPNAAEACGCFAPPSPAEPVVQAGERIVFSHKDGKVTAHIQIQYQGDADEFAWLVPMPKIPELRLGSEELFTQIQATTNPQFLLNRTGNCGGGGSSFGCASADFAVAAPNSAGGVPEEPIAVKVASAGPYDYAVVRADDKQPMVDWLNDNRFFVPDGTAEAMDPYIHEGAYFLALKLRAGESTGDLQPVILEYEADLPMIPIILTAVAATKDMGVLVWVLGEDRAIPHNYQHVDINEEYIDWMNGAANYQQVVARAIDEAAGGHAFITEYAGTTAVMRDVLGWPGRFPSREAIEQTESLWDLMDELSRPGWPQAAVRSVLERNYPMPEAALSANVSADRYYENIARMVQQYDPERVYDAMTIAEELWERVVTPTLESDALFDDNTYMTRLFTTLDPEEMTKDPVFAFNPDLPEVQQVRTATLENTCNDSPAFIMHLSDGRAFQLDSRQAWNERSRDVPRTRLISVFRQEGAGEIVTDNRALLADSDDGVDAGGCQNSTRGMSGAASLAMMFLLVGIGRRSLRRRD